MSDNSHFETLQVHAGHTADPTTGACATPIYQTSAFEFPSVQSAADIFALKTEGNIYTRLSNPTTAVFEKRIAALEKGSDAVATSSGQAATFLTIQSLASQGDNIVCSSSLYGGSISLFKNSFSKLGIEFRFANGCDRADFETLIDERTKGIFVESIGNSDFLVPEFDALSDLCAKHKIPFIVDNTFCAGGYVFQPATVGAAVIVHSATKWIGGHGNSMAGVLVDCGVDNWDSEKFPQLTGPCAAYHNQSFSELFGASAFAQYTRLVGMRDWGSCISPFNSFLMLQGVETLSLRAQREMDNALELAQWLQAHPKVAKVNYIGLEGNPNHQRAKKYFKHGFGAVMSVEVKGDKKQTGEFVDRLELIANVTNLGDNKTLIVHSASTTHGQLSDAELKAAGISPGSLRVCLGIEHIDDIKADFAQALAKL